MAITLWRDGGSDARKLKALEDENRRLKKLLALDASMLKEILGNNFCPETSCDLGRSERTAIRNVGPAGWWASKRRPIAMRQSGLAMKGFEGDCVSWLSSGEIRISCEPTRFNLAWWGVFVRKCAPRSSRGRTECATDLSSLADEAV